MNTQLIISTYKVDPEEIERLLEELNKVLSENEKVLENIYQTDIFIKKCLGELEKVFPELLKHYNDVAAQLKWLAKYTGLDLKNTEPEIDNPYIKDTEKPNNIKETTKEEKQDIKTLYRKICKLTHPDKIKNIVLNKYFLTAKKLYKKQDYQGLLEIYDLVIIEYETNKHFKTSEDTIILIKQKIYTTINDTNTYRTTLLNLQLSPTYNIATKFSKDETKDEAKDLFINYTNGIINHMLSQINHITSVLNGVH